MKLALLSDSQTNCIDKCISIRELLLTSTFFGLILNSFKRTATSDYS